MGKQKLELTWIGKEKRPKLEPRILLEDPEKSYHAKHHISDSDIFDNRLIYGDNLLALKALEQEFSGKVKCVYIDPPYNTGSAFTHYDDGLEHSIWLGLMRDRLEILWRLLEENGSLWVSIDDSEMPYLRILLDEVCGRRNFIASNIWQKRYSRENREAIGDAHEYVIAYAKDPEQFKRTRNKLPLGEKQLSLSIRIRTMIRRGLGVPFHFRRKDSDPIRCMRSCRRLLENGIDHRRGRVGRSSNLSTNDSLLRGGCILERMATRCLRVSSI